MGVSKKTLSDAVKAHLGSYTSITRPADTEQETKEDTMAEIKLHRPTLNDIMTQLADDTRALMGAVAGTTYTAEDTPLRLRDIDSAVCDVKQIYEVAYTELCEI